jgi:choline transport protein
MGITANTLVQMYGVTHSDFEAKQWHVFVTYLVRLDPIHGATLRDSGKLIRVMQITTWIACACVCLFNSAMPHLNTVGIGLILAGFLITVIVV